MFPYDLLLISLPDRLAPPAKNPGTDDGRINPGFSNYFFK